MNEAEAMENSPETSADSAVTHPWTRYVAMGDSFTEGIGDPEPASPGGHRGWADRVAEELSRGHDDLRTPTWPSAAGSCSRSWTSNWRTACPSSRT